MSASSLPSFPEDMGPWRQESPDPMIKATYEAFLKRLGQSIKEPLKWQTPSYLFDEIRDMDENVVERVPSAAFRDFMDTLLKEMRESIFDPTKRYCSCPDFIRNTGLYYCSVCGKVVIEHVDAAGPEPLQSIHFYKRIESKYHPRLHLPRCKSSYYPTKHPLHGTSFYPLPS